MYFSRPEIFTNQTKNFQFPQPTKTDLKQHPEIPPKISCSDPYGEIFKSYRSISWKFSVKSAAFQ